jgi:transposase
MSLATAELPADPAALRAFALACQGELKAAQTAVQLKALEIEKLRFQIAKLRRMQFGRSSERITRQIEQLELQLEELETGEAEDVARAEADDPDAPAPARAKPKRKPLPEHLRRQEVLHQPAGDSACVCPACGGGMGKLGEDVTEVLDYVPGHFQVIRHVRPKYACRACDAITQAPAPAMPTPRGRATPAMLAHLLVSKYCDHLPLYRQCEIYARQGLELDRSTLCDWVGQAAWLLDPIVAAIRAHVFAAEKIHGDDTTVPVLSPGLGRTKTGRLWAYVRDDRPFCGGAPPAVAYFYSPDRTGAHPAAHLAGFTGLLQADAYAGFEKLYGPARTTPRLFRRLGAAQIANGQTGTGSDCRDLCGRSARILCSRRRASGTAPRTGPSAGRLLRLGNRHVGQAVGEVHPGRGVPLRAQSARSIVEVCHRRTVGDRQQHRRERHALHCDALVIMHPFAKYLETLGADFRQRCDTGVLCARSPRPLPVCQDP